MCVLGCFSHVWLFAIIWTVAHQVSVHGILQARILGWVAILSSRDSSQPRDRTPPSSTSSASADGFFTTSATWEIPETHCIYSHLLGQITLGFPGGSEVKVSASNVGDLGLIPGLGRSPGEGNGNPVQYSCLENPMDRGAWWATVHRVAKVARLHFHFLSLLM